MSVSMQHLKQCQQLPLQVVDIFKHAVKCLMSNTYVRTRTSYRAEGLGTYRHIVVLAAYVQLDGRVDLGWLQQHHQSVPCAPG